jgi:hypothetical protein
MTAQLPPYVPKSLVGERLPLIFPEGTPNRLYCTRDLAASTVFVMLYIGAVVGNDQYLAPKHVYRMTEEQAAKDANSTRVDYAGNALKPGYQALGERWYADNTREPIRDETLREGLVELGAVVARHDLPTTSSKPRYALDGEFAALFDPDLTDKALEMAIADWQKAHLSPGALARVSLMRLGAAAGGTGVLVTFPNGETRNLAPGPSSIIAQAVIEVFTERFLDRPAVLWLSESGNKVVARDDRLAAAIGLKIEADKNLPDIILADLGPAEPLIVFVEVVATDGAVTPRRREALLALTDAVGFKRSRVAFLTAYQDRESSGFKKTVAGLAWGSFAWFLSEPEQIVVLRDGATSPALLSQLMAHV